ncbi:MAG: tetratricopeptide repeat protein [Acidobacteriota bacterium]
MLTRLLKLSRAPLALAAAAALAACGPDLPPLEPIPEQDLSAVEASVERQISDARSAVEVATRRGGGGLQRVADAYGSLGEIYHAYGLIEPADAAYANAATLDPGAFAWPYYRGLLAQAAGDFAAARGHLEKALELRGGSVPARWRLGEVQLTLGDAAGAAKSFSAIANVEESAAVAAYGLGRAAQSAGDLETAARRLREALELAPESGAVAHALAQALRALGRDQEIDFEPRGSAPPSLEDPLARRIETLATSAGSLLKRGNQALVAGRLEVAESLFRRGIETDPDHIELRLNLANALIQAGRLGDAALELRAAVERAPEGSTARARAHHDLGTVMRAQGDNEDAVAEFKSAVALEPDYLEAHFNLANSLGVLERWPEVQTAAARVVEIDPEHARARYLLAMARFRQGERDVAEAELRRLVNAEPGEPAFREGLGSVLAETRRTSAAAAALRGIEPAAPDGQFDDETRLRLLRFGAPILWRYGDRRTAISMWRESAEMDPSSRSFTDLANGLQLDGQRTEAQEQFTRAVELDPSNATAWLSEARLLILSGELARADRRLRQALALHPKHPGLASTLARLLATAPDASLRDGRLAVELARLAYGVELSIEHGETLAMALAEFGNFEQAIGVQRRIAQQAQIAGDRATLRRLVANLKKFEKRLPIRVAVPES